MDFICPDFYNDLVIINLKHICSLEELYLLQNETPIFKVT